MTTVQVPAANKARRFNWPRIFGYDFFISFKLGNPPIGAQSYASDLARRLRELDFTVFYSEEETQAGEKLDSTLEKALHRSRILVVIANEGALVHSKWVRKEVEEFRSKHPKRPIIPINVDHAIEKYGRQPKVEASQWLDPDGRIWLDETQDAIAEGIVNPAVLTRLQIVPRFTKANTWFRRMVAVVILMLIGLASWAGYEALDANRKFRDATAMRLAAEGDALLSGSRRGGDERAMLQLIAADRLAPNLQVKRSLLNALIEKRDLQKLVTTTEYVSSIVFSPKNDRLITMTNSGLRLWNAQIWQPIGEPLKQNYCNNSPVTFSADGKRIVSTCYDTPEGVWWRDAGHWDAETGQSIRQLSEGQYRIITISFDGRRIATQNSNGTLQVRDAKNGQPIGSQQELPHYTYNRDGNEISVTPDGKRVAFWGLDEPLKLWDVETGVIVLFKGHQNGITRVIFSPDSTRIVSVDSTPISENGSNLQLWDSKTGLPIDQALQGHNGAVYFVAFSPDSTRIVTEGGTRVSENGSNLQLWDAKTGLSIGQDLQGNSVAFSPDSTRIVSVDRTPISENGSNLQLWDSKTGLPIGQALQGHNEAVNFVAFTPDSKRIVSGSRDKTLRLWDAETGQPIGKALEGHQNDVVGVVFSPDSKRIASWSWDNTMRLWNTETGQPIGSALQGHIRDISFVAFSPDGKHIVSGSRDKTLRMWVTEPGQPIGQALQGHKGSIMSVAFSPDGKLIASVSTYDDVPPLWDANTSNLRLWDAETSALIPGAQQGHADDLRSVAFSPDGKLIATGAGESTLQLWDAKTGAPIGKPLQGHSGGVRSVAFSPDSKLIASGGDDRSLRLWDAKTGTPTPIINQAQQKHTGTVNSVAFSPDGKHIVSGSSGPNLTLWTVEANQLVGKTFQLQQLKRDDNLAAVNSVAFSPDGKTIVSGGEDETIRLWDVKTAQPTVQAQEGEADKITSLAYSPDGNYIVSGGVKSLRLWDGKTGAPIGPSLMSLEKSFSSVAFSPDGSRIVSASFNEPPRLWPTPKVWADELCKKLNRNMSHKEWNDWVSPDIDYIEQCHVLPIPPDEPETTTTATEQTQP